MVVNHLCVASNSFRHPFPTHQDTSTHSPTHFRSLTHSALFTHSHLLHTLSHTDRRTERSRCACVVRFRESSAGLSLSLFLAELFAPAACTE